MEDQLKKFVEQNRQDFDFFETDTESLWLGVKQGLAPRVRRFEVVKVWAWRVAAAVVLVAGLGWFISNTLQNSENQELASIELLEAEKYYGGLINQKMRVIQTHSTQIDPALFRDLAALDSAYRELKTDLKDNAANAEVVNAMIQHYRIKLKLLEDILEELEAEKNESNQMDTRSL